MENVFTSSALFSLVVLSCYAAHFSGQLSARVSAYSEESVKGDLRAKSLILYGTSRFGLSCAILGVIDAALPFSPQQNGSLTFHVCCIAIASFSIATPLTKALMRNGHRSISKSPTPPELS